MTSISMPLRQPWRVDPVFGQHSRLDRLLESRHPDIGVATIPHPMPTSTR